ncbi:MAG: type II asparaginase [Alphaproteobacteria bacterium]|nr:type II asparaginase [Alphaproteobacteria bacterium]
MKKMIFCLALAFTLDAHAKNIVILATGGTIAGAGESVIGSVYSPGKIGIEQIIKNIPGITKLAEIKAEQIMQKASQDFNANDWLLIAKKINEALAKRSVHGAVITHGTDTLEETAYFLNLVVKSKKPVVLVGSMRPSTSLSADGSLNLYNAVALANSDTAYNKGVLVMLNDEIFAARDVAKTHTTNVATFKSPNTGPIGEVLYGKTKIYYNPLRTHTDQTVFDVRKLESLPKVDIVYAYSGADEGTIDYLVSSGSQAIILAGVGDGNINQKSVERLKEAAKKGVLVVRSAHLGAGVVEPNVEINDDEFGFVTADNLSPQKARILAILALTKTKDIKKIRKFFEVY